jgi:hypothetical protein
MRKGRAAKGLCVSLALLVDKGLLTRAEVAEHFRVKAGHLHHKHPLRPLLDLVAANFDDRGPVVN